MRSPASSIWIVLVALVGTTGPATGAAAVGPDTAWPDAVTACLDYGVFLNERQLVSLGDDEVEKGPAAVRKLFRERALPRVDNPEVLEEAETMDSTLFIIAEEHRYFSDITREMRLPTADNDSITVKIRARADRFAEKRETWEATASATGPVDVTLVNRNNTTEALGAAPAKLLPKFVFSNQGRIRFSHEGSGERVAIPTTLFLETLQRARKLCDS